MCAQDKIASGWTGIAAFRIKEALDHEMGEWKSSNHVVRERQTAQARKITTKKRNNMEISEQEKRRMELIPEPIKKQASHQTLIADILQLIARSWAFGTLD